MREGMSAENVSIELGRELMTTDKWAGKVAAARAAIARGGTLNEVLAEANLPGMSVEEHQGILGLIYTVYINYIQTSRFYTVCIKSQIYTDCIYLSFLNNCVVYILLVYMVYKISVYILRDIDQNG